MRVGCVVRENYATMCAGKDMDVGRKMEVSSELQHKLCGSDDLFVDVDWVSVFTENPKACYGIDGGNRH